MEKIIICDSGGSKTVLKVLSKNGEDLKTFNCVGFGKAQDSKEELEELVSLLNQIDNKDEIIKVVVNLGGKNKEQVYTTIKNHLKGAKVLVFRESEGEVLKALSKKHSAEIVLLAGTGAIAYASDDHKNGVVCGGWGMNISDQGSGYDIGLSAIKRSLLELEENKPLSMITKKITGRERAFTLGEDFCLERDKVRANFIPLDRKKTASYAKEVLACANSGDDLSIDILKSAGEDLANQIIRTAKLVGLNKLNGVVVCGGVINCGEFITKPLEEKVKKSLEVNKFVYDIDGVIEGVKYIALNDNN